METQSTRFFALTRILGSNYLLMNKPQLRLGLDGKKMTSCGATLCENLATISVGRGPRDLFIKVKEFNEVLRQIHKIMLQL